MSDPDYRIACARLEAANKWFREEIARLRLTDAERDAVLTAALEADAHQHTQRAATLRGLLERMI